MALNKQSVNLNFLQGLDTKTDPFQVQPGKFLQLENSIFTKGGLLQKRNGYGSLASLPDTTSTFATTFNGNLTAIGTKLEAYSQAAASWVNKGAIQPVEVDVLPLIRNTVNQIYSDTAIASNGLVCTVYVENDVVAGSIVPTYKYAIADSVTGQNIVAPTLIPTTGGTLTGGPKVYYLGNYFIMVFTNHIGGADYLQWISINAAVPTTVSSNINISTAYTASTTGAFDATVVGDNLYIAWNTNSSSVKVTYIDSGLTQHSSVTFSGSIATLMSVCGDVSGTSNIINVCFYNSGTSTGYVFALTSTLATIHGPTEIITSGTVLNLASAAQNGVCTVYYEVANNYSYDSSIASHYIESVTITEVASPVVGTPAVFLRSVGLSSKTFIINSVVYFLVNYSSAFQPTYFLVNQNASIVAKIGYENGGGYSVLGLNNPSISGSTAQISYLYKDLISSVNKTQGEFPGSANGIYSQTGVNLVTFDITTSDITSVEIGNGLHISGGILWLYDGYRPVEHMFFLWPDNVEVTTATTGGNLIAQQYFYQVTYEWADNQGNVFRSAPSIPTIEDISSSMTSTNTNTINVPTLRLTYKTANPVKIVIYRWSTAQPVYYQITSLTTPLLNDPMVDSIAFVDTQADTAILGNNILYTTGGVVENIATPPVAAISLFDDRLFYIDAEDKNLLGYSKQVIEATPVETSDLLTIYVAPSSGAQGSTGPMRCLAAMDDKLIIFKDNAIYYINGTGPDNTGANSAYSPPTFITATVGSNNQHSIVFMPNGLMFQSDKGIWVLGRDLSTNYIGAPVEKYTTNATVQSAVNVPGTNQVRFTLDSGITLMYDYYYGQWGTFINVPAISSTLYQDLHTYINSTGQVFQETPGLYLDGSKPVLMNFTTSWLNMSGLQGYERAYYFYFLGTYLSPHKLAVGIAYDYAPGPSQLTTITPDNFVPNWGGEAVWGSGGPWGGSNIEQWRVFLNQQKCQAFQISISEVYDPTYGVAAGAGLTLSGLDIIIGQKSSYPRIRSSRSAS